MNQLKLQKKRQRKEAKRNLKRKTVRKYLNELKGLGKTRRIESINNGRRTANINSALAHLDAIMKKWNDKISPELELKVKDQKAILKTAMKSKKANIIQEAVNNFVPLNQEVIEIVKKYDV